MSPGRELDKLVAEKVFGYVVVDRDSAQADYAPRLLAQADAVESDPDMGSPETRANLARLMRGNAAGGTNYYVHDLYIKPEPSGWMGDYTPLPHYSTDISAAWEALNSVPSIMVSVSRGEAGWWCVIYPATGPAIEGEYAPTAPHAICLALLESVGFEGTKPA